MIFHFAKEDFVCSIYFIDFIMCVLLFYGLSSVIHFTVSLHKKLLYK